MAQTVLILGAGVGGLVAAHELRKRLPREHRVVLVDREATFSLAASFLWVMNGARRPEQIQRPLAPLRRKGIEVWRGEVRAIDPQRRRADVGDTSLTADHVIVALGADFTPEAVPGLAEAGETFCTIEGAVRLRDEIRRFGGGRIVVLTAAPAYKCPAAPYEAAMLVDAALRKRGVRERCRLDIYAAEPAPMGVAGPDVSAAVRGMVEQKGIGYHPDHQLVRADRGARTLEFANGSKAEFDLLAYVPPIRAPRVVRDCGLADATGWVPVDRTTMETRFPGVYALGDVTIIPLSLGKPLPKAGVFAHGQAEVVARRVAAAVMQTSAAARFDGHGACFIEGGAGRAGYGAGDFYAEPRPVVKMYRPSRLWHGGKVLFEKHWFWKWL